MYLPWTNKSMIDSGLCLSLIRQIYSPVSEATNGLKCKLKFSDKNDTWKWKIKTFLLFLTHREMKLKSKKKKVAQKKTIRKIYIALSCFCVFISTFFFVN